MPKLDKDTIKVGMFIVGDAYAASHDPTAAPITYGQRRPNLADINARLDAARRRLEEIAAAVREARRR